MYTDKKVLHILSGSTLAVLLLALILPGQLSGRILAACLLLPLTAATHFLVKKRSILSINSRQVLLLLSVMGALYVMLYYLSGIRFGFYRSAFRLCPEDFFQFVLPIGIIIVSSEYIRSITRAQLSRWADILAYLSCVCAEVLICSRVSNVRTLNQFMDMVGLTLLPALVSNLLYHYLSKRYGPLPNIAYRLLTSLFLYIIPYRSAISDSLIAFAGLIIPLLIYLFIDTLFEKKRVYALVKKSKLGAVLSIAAVAVMLGAVMLISNQFRFGALVIATESMTGELNKGDAAIFQRYEDPRIENGQVIVFEKNNSMVVHRVIDIETINGSTRYYTQGDANETPDTGFITKNEIVGIVEWKVPYVGYPTLWLRSLFS